MIYTSTDPSFQAGVNNIRNKLLEILEILRHPVLEGEDDRAEVDLQIATKIVEKGPKDTFAIAVEDRVYPLENYDLDLYNQGQHAYVQEMITKVGEVRKLSANKKVKEYKF